MKKVINLFVTFTLFFSFIPFNKVDAASSYSVEMVSSSSGNKVIGTYNTYSSALSAMNSQSSSATEVATIYRNGVPVDSKYGIFKFKPGSVYKLYRYSGSSTAYTSIHSSYGSDAALLGYSDNGRVKIMISGFTGWTDLNNGVVTPISLLSANMINVNGQGVRLRSEPSLSGSQKYMISGSYNFNYTDTRNSDGYTWYKINYNGSVVWVAGGDWVTKYGSALGTYYLNYGQTGNLIHHFAGYSGVSYNDNFTNLGTAPSFLNKDVRYYSFDGNYFYSNLTSMLNDYRNGNYNSSVNKDNPYYAYYLYLTARSTTGYSASDLDSVIASKGYSASTSKMYGTGVYFKEAEEKYGTNALLAFSAALNESNWGTSSIAMSKNNLFGYGAADSCPVTCAYSYGSPKDSIMSYASSAASSYEAVGGSYYFGSHYGNKSSGKNVNYATDPYWGEKMAMNAFLRDKEFGGKDFNSNTIGVTKKGLAGAWVFSKPEQTEAAHLYTLKSNGSDPVYDFSINVIDKVEANGKYFYKVYTDLSSRNPLYGYVEASEWNVSNNQPVINASDREIKVGDNFNYLEGVSATDKENGNLTNRITYEGTVDTTKEGNYKVTYTAVDNSNFHVSKTINVKVINNNEPKIEASNREVKQFEEFDYLDEVKAYDNNGSLEISFDETVDTSKAGEYTVIYKAKNGVKEVSKEITVTVIPDSKPIIEAEDSSIKQYQEFNYLEGVKAYDEEDGDISDISYEGTVDTSKTGDYKVIYSVSDKNGQVTKKEVVISVLKDLEPTISASDKMINIKGSFNPLEDVLAYDEEDGDITSKITYSGNVDVNTAGEYKVTYTVSDSRGQKTSKTIIVTVSLKTASEVEGLFYLDSFKEVDGKLQLKGYNTINGINNDLDTDIEYEVHFENVETGDIIKLNADRIDDEKEMSRQAFGLDDKDYTYSWFKLDIDLNKIKQGNYIMYVVSKTEDYFSKNIINNKTYKKMDSSFSGDKYVIIRNNYSYQESPIELIVRDNALAEKTSGNYYNQFDKYTKFEFSSNKLHLKGLTYSYGADLSLKANVERKIIFENKENYKTYVKDLGSITNGSYEAILPESDGFDKTRAWYDASIDLSDIPNGEYIIYITTKTNITDIYEFTEKLGRSLDNVKEEIGGRTYSFTIDYKHGNRIEMIVK